MASGTHKVLSITRSWLLVGIVATRFLLYLAQFTLNLNRFSANIFFTVV